MNANARMSELTKERDQQRTQLDSAEVRLEHLEKENAILKDTNYGLESKNAELFRQLEREISTKAKDYKERTLGTLSSINPFSNTMQTPDISQFSAQKIYRPTISKNPSPFES